MSKKDVKALGIVFIIGIIFLIPIYNLWKRKAERSECRMNVGQIGKAISLYAEQNDDRFPPVYATAENPGPGLDPMVDDRGAPFTWASLVKDGMNSRTSFKCPSSKTGDNVLMQSDGQKELEMSYGMYGPYGSYPRNLVENPGGTILIAETCNFGSHRTCDPVHFADRFGRDVRADGFLIGFDKSNFDPKDARYVTRLAIYDTLGGTFSETSESRHDGGIHVLYCDGHTGQLKPEKGSIHLDAQGMPTAPWATPPLLKQSR